MKIDPNISLDDFCTEMQHRVIRYSLRSLAVRQALRFARKHDDPEFYRVAANKIHAQRQFQREMNGPGLFERTIDYFSLGSLREVVVTLILVGLAVVGIDAGRGFLDPHLKSSTFEQMEVDQLAKRLGILLDDSNGLTPVAKKSARTSPLGLPSFVVDASDGTNSQLSEADVQRIVKAVLVAIQKQDLPSNDSEDLGAKLSTPIESNDQAQVENSHSTVSLASSEVPEPTIPK